jgi:cytochrome c oxidase assembly protein subunit 15
MDSTEHRLVLLRRMALLCAALVLVITSLSATMRLTKAGLGCADWPQCYGRSLREAQRGVPATAGDSPATAALRLIHRVVAMAALLLVLVLVMTCLSTRPLLWREGRLALALLACALFLAVLGRSTAQARVPAVAIGNLLGGFVMLALAWRLARSAGTTPGAPHDPLARWAWLGVALLLWQIALGGLVSTSFAGLSCPELSGCDASASSWRTLDPWREPQWDAAEVTNPAGALAHGLHRASALVVAGVLLALAAAAWHRGRPRAAATLVALLAVQAGLGVVLVAGQLPLAAALAHNLVAALLLAASLDLTLARLTLR